MKKGLSMEHRYIDDLEERVHYNEELKDYLGVDDYLKAAMFSEHNLMRIEELLNLHKIEITPNSNSSWLDEFENFMDKW